MRAFHSSSLQRFDLCQNCFWPSPLPPGKPLFQRKGQGLATCARQDGRPQATQACIYLRVDWPRVQVFAAKLASIVLLGLGPVQFAPAWQLELHCVLLCFLYSRRPGTELHRLSWKYFTVSDTACVVCVVSMQHLHRAQELLAPDDSPFLEHGFLQGAVLSGAMFKGSPVRSQQYAKRLPGKSKAWKRPAATNSE